jgi:hypothetical protein
MEINMATVNKSDRKKLITTQVIGPLVVFMRADTGEEITRLDTDDVSGEMQEALMVYGTKQIVSDIVASLDGIDDKASGMVKACDQLRAGAWPRRASQASVEPAIAMLMAAQGITRDAALKLLGL